LGSSGEWGEMSKIEPRYNLCPNCYRNSNGKLHCSIDGNDADFCDELCVASYSRKFPTRRITVIEGFCEHGDEDYKVFLEKCEKCGNIRSVR